MTSLALTLTCWPLQVWDAGGVGVEEPTAGDADGVDENQPSPGVTGGGTGHTAWAQPEIHRPPVHSGYKVMRTNLPLALPEGVQDILPELNQKFTGLLSTLVTR